MRLELRLKQITSLAGPEAVHSTSLRRWREIVVQVAPVARWSATWGCGVATQHVPTCTRSEGFGSVQLLAGKAELPLEWVKIGRWTYNMCVFTNILL